MRTTLTLFILTLAAVLTAPVSAQNNQMTFFVSSTGSGMGGNLGGLAGADKLCQGLAAKAGAGNRTWRAYLSTSMPDANARDRIGKGPWQNAKGVVIAANVDELHSDKANINNDTALDEMGRQINPQGAPNRHDILTGSTPEGRATTMTCQNWTSSAGDQTRDARASRSPDVRQAGITVERGAPLEGLLAGEPGRDGRRGSDLLLRGELRPRNVRLQPDLAHRSVRL